MERSSRAATTATLRIGSCLVGAMACLPAQDIAEGAHDLVNLRAAFASEVNGSPRVVIAIVENAAPVVLYSGRDTDGGAVEPHTYMSLGALVRLMVADAAHAKFRGDLRVGSGVTIGTDKLTVRELIRGTSKLPDYWDWDGGGAAIGAEDLLACAEFAAGAGFIYPTSTLGMAEFLLLEPSLSQGPMDWPSFLRTSLAPHVTGLDPVLASDLDADASVGSSIAKDARPAALQLMVTIKHLATWWQWRVHRSDLLWDGPRMGHRETNRVGGTNRIVPFWRFDSSFPTVHAAVFPEHSSGILYLATKPGGWRSIDRAFEDDLFGTGDELWSEVAIGIGNAMLIQPLTRWKGKEWATDTDAPSPLTIAIEDATVRGVHMEFADRSWRSAYVYARNKGMIAEVAVPGEPESEGMLYLWPKPSEQDPKRLEVVFVENKKDRGRIPHHFDLELVKKQ